MCGFARNIFLSYFVSPENVNCVLVFDTNLHDIHQKIVQLLPKYRFVYSYKIAIGNRSKTSWFSHDQKFGVFCECCEQWTWQKQRHSRALSYHMWRDPLILWTSHWCIRVWLKLATILFYLFNDVLGRLYDSLVSMLLVTQFSFFILFQLPFANRKWHYGNIRDTWILTWIECAIFLFL